MHSASRLRIAARRWIRSKTRRTAPDARARALQTVLTRHYDGDATAALLDLARIGEVAVAYLDRTWFASYLDESYFHPLTDKEWAQVVPHLEDYDEYVEGRDVEFADKVIADALNLAFDLD